MEEDSALGKARCILPLPEEEATWKKRPALESQRLRGDGEGMGAFPAGVSRR
jgi:hypothetical protein